MEFSIPKASEGDVTSGKLLCWILSAVDQVCIRQHGYVEIVYAVIMCMYC